MSYSALPEIRNFNESTANAFAEHIGDVVNAGAVSIMHPLGTGPVCLTF